MTEHYIHIESTQVYRGGVGPEQAERLTGDAEEYNYITGSVESNSSFGLDFHKEVKLTFECECGERFRKGRTAREHLEKYND